MLQELTLFAEHHCAEALADALIDAGALSVTIEDAQAQTPDEEPLYGEPGLAPARLGWTRSRLRVMIDEAKTEQVLAEAGAAIGGESPHIEECVTIADTDWVRATREQFPPTQISERLWIVPSWHLPPAPPALAVRLDPGVAFGTGTHPTTRMCLAWLDANLKPASSILDYGCGSGILAIAAAKLGAARIVGTDIDPQALAAARANSKTNRVRASYTDPNSLGAATFDVVLANILSNPLKLLAPALLARVAPRGSLVLSGVLERQAEEVIAAYGAADSDLRLSVWRAEEGWACLAGRRP